MPDAEVGEPYIQKPWPDAAYLSAIPDFRHAPDTMFNAPYGWETPDPAWQRKHQGWQPGVMETPMAGYPLAILRWRFWVPKAELKRTTRSLRIQRVTRYAFFASLFSLGFLTAVAFLFGVIFPPLAIYIILVAGSSALAGSIALFVVMVPLVALLDFTYLAGVRRGLRGNALTWWTVAPVVVLDIVVTQGLAWLFYWATVAYNGAEDILSAFTLIGALLSLGATVAALITYALKELRLQQ